MTGDSNPFLDTLADIIEHEKRHGPNGESLICSGCKKIIGIECKAFESPIEVKEWSMSGLCKECQDEVFKQ